MFLNVSSLWYPEITRGVGRMVQGLGLGVPSDGKYRDQ